MHKNIFVERRRKVFKKLQNAVMIIPANPELIRNNDVHFEFRQESNFYYLTGFDEPDAIAVLKSIKGKEEFILFVRPKDLSKEIWTGFRAGVEGAASLYGANKAYPVSEFDSQASSLLQGSESVYYSFFKTLHRNGVELLDQKILRLLDEHRASLGRTGLGLKRVFDANELLAEMRLFKSKDELDCLRKAAEISTKAHLKAMACCRPGLFEYQIEALIEFIFRNEGSARYGYPSIVASGPNATILHYVENNRELLSSDFLLIDAGTEWNFYTADITRTFPVSGKMTVAQEEIYKIVLDVQKECVKMARPGQTMLGIHNFAVKALTRAMISLGFLKGSAGSLIKSLAYKKYYPHGTGHFLGMDVHDVGLYYRNGEPRKLEPGMVFTVEPGFYVLEKDRTVPSRYCGIGVRIEDDVVITRSGNEVLTSAVPKEVDEMCSLVGTKSWPNLF